MLPFDIEQVQPGSPAHGQLLRGDIITKIQDYDARDIRNIDAQNLFRNADNHIRLVVRRDCKLSVATNIQSVDVRSASSAAMPPYQQDFNLLHVDFDDRSIQSLPRTDFQHIDLDHSNGSLSVRSDSRATSRFSPMPTRDHQQDVAEEAVAIATQVSDARILLLSWICRCDRSVLAAERSPPNT